MFSQKGVRQESGQYLDDRKTGKWIEYLPTGEQWRTVNYVDGERNSVDSQNCAEQGGSWTVKFDSLEEGCEQGPMGFKLGTWRSYHLNGSIKLVTPYKENALHGLVKGYHPTGQLHRIGRFEQGQPVRSHSYFNANGSIIGESYIDKNGHGKWEVWHHTGAIAETGDYDKGKKNGLWKTFSDKGIPKEETTYLDGVPFGKFRSFYITGEVNIEGNHLDGLREGYYLLLHQRAGRTHHELFAGRLNGEWKRFITMLTPRNSDSSSEVDVLASGRSSMTTEKK